MTESREPIGVIGVGWVGLVTAACFADLGHPVVARDILPEKVAALSRGETTIHEPELDELLERNAERLTFTTDMDELLAATKLLFVCVDTPPTRSGDADLSRVRSVVEELAPDSDHVLIMKSTVPAGTGEAIRRDRPGLAYVSCPEFLKEGSAVADFLHPDRVVIGADAGDRAAGEAVAGLYEPLGGEIVHTDVASAEMIKLASNAFLATKISFVNEIANVCEEVGADVGEVARGMGLDQRIGSSFLRAGIGYGGSCFDGRETLLVRHQGTAKLVSFEGLWELCGGDEAADDGEAIAPESLLAWSWVPGEDKPEWMPVSVLTKRDYDGDMVEVRTKMGRRVQVTADHPFYVGDGRDEELLTRILAGDLNEDCWLPLALGAPRGFESELASTLGAIEDGVVALDKVRVKPSRSELVALAERPVSARESIFSPRDPYVRMHHVNQSGLLRLTEAVAADIDLNRVQFSTPWSKTFVPPNMRLDQRFWRVLGLYLAEGCVIRQRGEDVSPEEGLIWSFHPHKEHHLVEEVACYWRDQGVRIRVSQAKTSERIAVHSRLIAAWWSQALGMGRNAYEQRIPDLAWEQSIERKKALLSGLWAGDGCLKLRNRGRSPVLEWGTVSDELADGVARLLGDVGIAAAWHRGRAKGSTKETHWLSISGADQIERSLFLVPVSERKTITEAIGHQTKRMAPAGFRRFDGGMAWVRVTDVARRHHHGPVYSLKVPGSQTVVVSGGLTVSQCFPKDLKALKQLAGNTGYHFQLLTAVIEVNELQKRRVVQKLNGHLGSLVGKRIALLGLAFKPNTDDMREASSLVLAPRLQGEGAEVAAYDPVAADAARDLLEGVELCDSALDALAGADAAVLVTEWPEFAELDWADAASRMARPLLVDGRNFLDPKALVAAGFEYEGIGRAPVDAPSAATAD
jgi:UDPglucose 6-dehydrogenase